MKLKELKKGRYWYVANPCEQVLGVSPDSWRNIHSKLFFSISLMYTGDDKNRPRFISYIFRVQEFGGSVFVVDHSIEAYHRMDDHGKRDIKQLLDDPKNLNITSTADAIIYFEGIKKIITENNYHIIT